MTHNGEQTTLPMRPLEQTSPATHVRKMNLLDLPIDVLKEIVKNLTHTNDLTSTALVHSALHSLAIPHIYSRFDIVWPDGSAAGEPRGGVDALTYGLATLNMAEDVFGEAEWQREKRQRKTEVKSGHSRQASERQIRKRRGNYYARYIRKFSLGNGPSDWVEEYLTNKEAGKMLGTLVALAIARMKSLESFVWDMPTGILNDVWTSLSYLGDREDGEPCRLEKLWIRWHKNTMLYPHMPPPPQDPVVPLLRINQSNALVRTEHPSFSMLPPLKSLSVLDIDEMQYLDEMSVLIGRSLDKLTELRVGISTDCRRDDWAANWIGDNYEQIDLSNPVRSTVTIGGRRRGGVLGVLTSSFLDLKQRDSPRTSMHRLRRISGAVPLIPSTNNDISIGGVAPPVLQPASTVLPATQSDTPALAANPQEQIYKPSHEVTASEVPDAQQHILGAAVPPPHPANTTQDSADPFQNSGTVPQPARSPEEPESPPIAKAAPAPSNVYVDQTEEPPRRLKLETLELEWVQLSIPVLTAALDWTRLTSITLLNCEHHDDLWLALHEEHAKDVRAARNSLLLNSPRPRRTSISIPHPSAVRLRLKNIHTNTVSLPLIRFVNECLAPNTLESLYLQDHTGANPSVPLETIFSAVIKLHRFSLRRLLIDSCKRKKSGSIARSASWKRWALTQDQIRYLTTPGKMPALKELGFCIEYGAAWHFFKQRLPGLPGLRSLYIPRYSSPYDAPEPAPKEVAMQLLDCVVFNGHMELCYMGVYDKCFEILEGEQEVRRGGVVVSSSRGRGEESSDEEDEEDVEEDEDEEEDEEDEGEHVAVGGVEGRRESTGDFEYVGSDEEDEEGGEDGRLHIREILFYDDKVPIFRVRHGKL
ncbi:Eukaryotic peptide chain release factor GTP-binding subunit [Elsinoe australis]|uniref:Eukaryotic peptide chain release factor GTP-binding subunit n=1 Tax=Elsinoe australis TaxID=40998 RepID=A0A2P7Z2P1_9PEZI|nr:Eukaryotic peptide chain release factor GTP-binding subunit [Elsinoe australis]